MKRLKNKVILITGGTSGIGRATALKLSFEDAIVIIAGRNEERGFSVVEEIQKDGGQSFFIKCDVANKNNVNELFTKVFSKFTQLDCIFNNAGIEGEVANFNESSEENWDKVIEINLKGTWHCMKYALRHMLEIGKGNIINMSSTSGLVGNGFGMSAYAASKFAIIGLTKSVALEYAKSNIRVNAICPAFVETPMIEGICNRTPKMRRRFEACQPIGRMAKAEEIAEAVLFLASDESKFITGSAFVIDGGLTI